MRRANFQVLVAWLFCGTTLAGPADVIDAKVRKIAPNVYRFEVTVQHIDRGWEHYADRYELLTPDGRSLAMRVLQHPHVDTQPFTRALDGVTIPPEIRRVTIRAHDSRHGYGGKEITLDLPE